MIDPAKLDKLDIWNLKEDKIRNLFQTTDSGLSEIEVIPRQEIFGHNQITEKVKRPLILEFLSKYLDPLILILLFASLLSAILGQVTNFIIIFIMLNLSVIIDFYQQYSAETAASKLQKQVSLKATVMREGHEIEIDAVELVPGDLISLAGGDVVPADARIISSRELLVNQSTLTGESYPQEKIDTELDIKNPNLDQITNMVYSGTSVLQGEAKAIVTAIGHKTELGKIAKELSNRRPLTEFELGTHQFGLFLMRVTFTLAIIVFFFNAIAKHDVLNSFLFALALAVGLTPELLPVVITINLSRGAQRMSKKGVIVKHLPSIQNFGGMQILTTDKTGTLTEDKIKLEYYENVFGHSDERVLQYGFLSSIFQSGLKNPMDTAILAHREVSTHGFKRLDDIPFDFQRRRLSVVVEHSDHYYLIARGAPEGIFSISDSYFYNGKSHPLTKTMLEKLNARFEQLSNDGFRVLALASTSVPKKKVYSPADEKKLTLLGLMAFLDPAKKDADDVVRALTRQGVEMKILTGDNELVTEKICRQIGLPIKGVITGKDIETKSQVDLFRIAQNNTIFARITPEQKERIILSLKGGGLAVGYLGDGINDAPSLRAADIGISVNNAVDVAKEAADIILLRKDLNILKEGIAEGRRTFANVMKYIMMGTSSNFGNMMSVAVASVFLPFLPMLPVQIILNNFLYDLSQIFLSGDCVDKISIERPERWNIKFIRKFMIVFGPISSIFDFLTFFLMLVVFKASISLFQTAWFIESLTTQTLVIFAIRTQLSPFYKSSPAKRLILSSFSILIFAWIVPFTFLGPIFGFSRPPISFYIILIPMVVFYITLVEIVKFLFYRTSRSLN